VNPGFGGQAFIPSALEKAKALRKAHPKLMLQIDEGIDATTAALARAAGVNNLVAGSSVFKAANRAAAILALRG
jgi:ribulose-phosphate 3-epimerase